jgi:hypothetical protein
MYRKEFDFYNAKYSKAGTAFEGENWKKLVFTTTFIQSMYDTIKELEEENKKLKADIACDEAVAAAQEEARTAKELQDKAVKDLYYGFSMEDRDKVDDWWIEHTAKERAELARQHKSLGPVAHRITFTIRPTEAGPIKMCYCSCGQQLNLTGSELK